MACGNTYGLLWIIVLLGHGLAATPARLWAHPSRTSTLCRLYAGVGSTHIDAVEAVSRLEVVEAELRATVSVAPEGIAAEHLDIVCCACYPPSRPVSCGGVTLPTQLGIPAHSHRHPEEEGASGAAVSTRGLARLHQRVKQVWRTLHGVYSVTEWRVLSSCH